MAAWRAFASSSISAFILAVIIFLRFAIFNDLTVWLLVVVAQCFNLCALCVRLLIKYLI